jgi:uncharacterized membrane protein YfcA
MATVGGLLLGVVIGVISGLVGIGGGALLIPALVFGYGLLLPIGVFAFWKYWKAGDVDLRMAILVALGFALGGWIGGSWAVHLSDVTLRRGFAVVLIVVAVRMLFK